MAVPTRIFEAGKPHCPGCHATLQELVDRCPHCGFTATACMQKFPYDAPPLARFIDPQGRLDDKSIRLASKAIRRLEKRFPQIKVFVCVTRLEAGIDVREFGYWLFNRSHPENVLDRNARYHGILLMIDRNSRAASLTVGYGLDPFLDDVTLARALEESATEMRHGHYGKGIADLMKQLKSALTKAHEKARASLDRWRRLGGRRSAVSAPDTPAPAPDAAAPHNPSEPALTRH